jgi:hypothetical protein
MSAFDIPKKKEKKRTMIMTTSTPNPPIAVPTGWEMKNKGTPTATKYRLLASHTK